MAAAFANLFYQGEKIGVAYWDESQRAASFQYTPQFVRSGVELSPLMMPLRNAPYQFPNLHESFGGLPGLLADCLPDTYGNALINDWLRQQGRSPLDFSPVERLCYIGARGMGALEFRPGLRKNQSTAEHLDVGRLTELAALVLVLPIIVRGADAAERRRAIETLPLLFSSKQPSFAIPPQMAVGAVRADAGGCIGEVEESGRRHCNVCPR